MESKTILLFVSCVLLAYVSAKNDVYAKWPNYKKSWLHTTPRFNADWEKATRNPVEINFDDFKEDFNFRKIIQTILTRTDSNNSYFEGATFPFWLIMVITLLFQILAFIFFIIGFVMKNNRLVCAKLSKKKYKYHICIKFFIYLLFLIFGVCVLAVGIDSVSKYNKSVNAQYNKIEPFLESITSLKDEVFEAFDNISKNGRAVSDAFDEFLKEAKSWNVDVTRSNDFKEFTNFSRDFDMNVQDSKNELPEITLSNKFKENTENGIYYIWMGGIILFATMFLFYTFRIGSTVLNITSCFNIVIGGTRACFWISTIILFFVLGTILVFISDSCAHADSIIHSIVDHKEFKNIVSSDNLTKENIDYYINCPNDENSTFFNALAKKANDLKENMKLQQKNFDEAYKNEIDDIHIYSRQRTANTLDPKKEKVDLTIDILLDSVHDVFNRKEMGLGYLLNCKRLRKKNEPIGRGMLMADKLCEAHVEQGAIITKMLIFLLTCDFILILMGLVSACCTVEKKEDENYGYRGEVDIVGAIPGAATYY